MPTYTVEVPAELEDFIASQIEAGHYKSASEALVDGLRVLQQEEDDRDFRVYKLREAIDEGDASGVAEGTIDEIFAEIRAEFGLDENAASPAEIR
jgi:antitoxin ParD1/3/4